MSRAWDKEKFWLKINWSVKTPCHERIEVARRSGPVWSPDQAKRQLSLKRVYGNSKTTLKTFFLFTGRWLFTVSAVKKTYIVSLRATFIHKIFLEQFLSGQWHLLIWEIVNVSLKFDVCRKRDSKSFSYSVCSLERKDNAFTGQISIQKTDYYVSLADWLIRWYTAFHRFDHLGQINTLSGQLSHRPHPTKTRMLDWPAQKLLSRFVMICAAPRSSTQSRIHSCNWSYSGISLCNRNS